MKRFFSIFIALMFVSSICLGQYLYENPVWVKNNTGTALTNVQVMIKFNTQVPISLGRMLANGYDIRFYAVCGGTTVLPHWVEGYLNTDSTKIWINVPSIGANDSTQIFLYYGNTAATNASTLSVFDGPHSSTDSVVVASTNTVSLCQRGFRFSANEDVLIGYFGKRTPNATQRYLTLFNFTTQAIVAQIQVDAGAVGVYNYNALPNPIWIPQGQQYIMTLFNGSGDMYYYGASSQIGQHLTYYDMRYANSCTQNTFPTSVLTAIHYGTPDFLYYTKQNVTPAPTFRVLVPADTLTPAAPLNLTATPGNTTALLKWNKNTEFDIHHYDCFRNTTNNPAGSTLIGTVLQPDTIFNATGLTNGTLYYFWVRAADSYCSPKNSPYSLVASCTPSPVSVGNNNGEIPKEFKLFNNYPNPFNPVTTIKFDLPKDVQVNLKIYDVLGKEVTVLVNEIYKAGSYQISFNGSGLASGIYFYKINAGSFTDIKRMILIK
jgi:hypothetical protein